ncbi:MAG: hypothetical protein V7459_07265 [Oceanicoccus sp.]
MLEMKIFNRLLLPIGLALFVSGCQTPPDIKTLESEKTLLQQQLTQVQAQIGQLEADNVLLQQDVAELNRVVSILGEEKSSRVTESTNLRGQVREFVQLQIDGLKDFLLASDLLDYIGGELVGRSDLDEEPVLIVDLYNSVPRNGTLTGVGGYFQNTGSISVRVLRPINNKLVVIWASQSVEVADRGVQRINFPVSVGVEKGDFLAYYLAQPGLISFDTGTGDTRYLDNNVAVGHSIKRSSLKGENDKRAYAIGVFGLLNTD